MAIAVYLLLPVFYVSQLSEAHSLCSTRHFIRNKKGARRQIGEDLLRLGKDSLWGYFAAPPHSPKSLELRTPIIFLIIFERKNISLKCSTLEEPETL